MKRKEWCTVISQEEIAPEIYSLWLETPSIAENAGPGQFVSLYCKDGSRLLPRPISLCEIDKARKRLHLVYRAGGKGTREFAGLRAGDAISVLGPLGNGFPLDEAKGKKILLMGGGIGIPPMLETARQVTGDKVMVLGYRSETFLLEDFQAQGKTYVATEDGSLGTKGNLLDVIETKGLEADLIFACGPKPMLRALKAYAQEKDIPCWISMEERMACGVGACLACVCQTPEVDAHSQVHNKRICKDGPVFAASEVEL